MNLIFIHGPAAAGKLTIARELSKITLYPVFHNHLIVDAVGAVFEFGSESFVRLRQEMWLSVFGDAARIGRSLIFTFAPEATVPPEFIGLTIELVQASGGDVKFVKLICPPEEQERRIENESRAEFKKLRSLETLRKLRSTGSGAFPELPDSGLTIDTSAHSASESAAIIKEFFALEPADRAHVTFREE